MGEVVEVEDAVGMDPTADNRKSHSDEQEHCGDLSFASGLIDARRRDGLIVLHLDIFVYGGMK